MEYGAVLDSVGYSERNGEEAPCDTITIAGVVDMKYIPLECVLKEMVVSAEEKRFVLDGLREFSLEIDSLWVLADDIFLWPDKIQLPLHYRSGLVKQIELNKNRQVMTGNWSGKDGTLITNRKTGISKFHSWF